MDYMLKRWDAFTRFLDDGRICLTNNAARKERFAELPWADARGCSLAPTATVSVARRAHPHRHRQAQLHRPAGLDRRSARPNSRDAAHPRAQAAALELKSRPGPSPGRVGRFSPHAASSNPPRRGASLRPNPVVNFNHTEPVGHATANER